MSTFFTSDLHLGHAKIIEYCHRPFAHVEEMNAELVRRWCDVVKTHDDVYILGDLAFCDPTLFFARLPGRKHLILGNHDQTRLKQLMALPFVWVKDVHALRIDGQHIWLSHYPHRSWPRSSHGAGHFHGHTHGDARATADIGAIDVGVDCWNYAPVEWPTLRDVLKSQPPKASHHAGAGE